jgi:hypothetical protein
MRSIGLIGSFAALAVGAPLAAQSNHFRTGDVQSSASTGQNQGGRRASNIPPGQMPPAGMCRIWIDGVPPGRQPASTDCQTAVANKPANARVIWGSQTSLTGNGQAGSRTNRDQTGQNTTVRGNGRDREDDVQNGKNDDNDDDENNSARSSQSPVVNGGGVNQSRGQSLKLKKDKGRGNRD